MLAHAGTPDELVAEVFFLAAGALGWAAVTRWRGRALLRLPRIASVGLGILCAAAVAGAVVVPSMIRPTWSPIRPRSDAHVRIVLPTPGEIVRGDSLEVDVDLIGARIAPLTSTTVSPTTGHLHVFIDGALLSMASAADTRVDISGLPNGRHVLRAEFVAADHGPFRPPVAASVNFDKESEGA
jgi:hypothetical protein